jgi:hypothetical protein
VLARLRDPKQPTVVTNARCLTEGIDVPSLDAIVFIDPRSSPVDIVQAVGRVMRIAKGKELGHVILPVFLREDELDDPESVIESSVFEPVLAVLRALRAHDPDLVTDATRVAASLGPRDAVVGGYVSQHLQFLGASFDIQAFQSALALRFVDVTADRWEVGYAQLVRFVEERGHARVEQRHITDDGFWLGRWVWRCRKDFANETLPPTKSARLVELPGWTWDPFEADFQEGLEHLREYIASNGDALVPIEYVCDDGFTLGAWVVSRRKDRTKGVLREGRIAALDEIPEWSWGPLHEKWMTYLARLREFVQREGHARVPDDCVTDDGLKLGSWVRNQRSRYRSKRLSQERIDALNAVEGWAWSNWDDGMKHLRAFVDREGHARVGADHICDDGHPLGTWVANRRHDYTAGTLSQERIDALNAVEGWAWSNWDDGMKHLRAFVEAEGHAQVRKNHVAEDGFGLGTWVSVKLSAVSIGTAS